MLSQVRIQGERPKGPAQLRSLSLLELGESWQKDSCIECVLHAACMCANQSLANCDPARAATTVGSVAV